ncbi:DeoR/GlpR family DNA-binding transcription regulator [Ruficoccus sp. ZRK36]|uniref:DeoR/GlpR family DNA-binding transcription regulator n=1 Tax=Ruficoccus sp. ZRK36 TaxID=2866311 RepID=UPI001C72FED6|nr:DeoR/GlpR family DNA-binding transcription regulator [Ruficoccus sp. ZRK36]QYY34337.1 DeoR/GlpR family DNA-binding transcription regulator [Ruficoccus sp. ZRK36]
MLAVKAISGNKPSQTRRREILDFIKNRRHCTVEEIGQQFDVSIPTIYRDVNELAGEGLISRTHGGVGYIEAESRPEDWAQSRFGERMTRQLDAKRKIARKAATLLQEDDVVFLDSSTTVLQLAREAAALNLGRLTIITNSCAIINEFPSLPPTMTLISIGGTYNPQLHSFLGGIATKTVESMRITKLFFSAVGISVNGAFTFQEDHARFLGGLTDMASPILLADSSKFQREALFGICDLTKLSVLVSDTQPPEDIQEACTKSQTRIL